MINYQKDLPFAITVCDKEGKIIEMNDNSIKTFESDGGSKLLGSNLLDCHPEHAKNKILEMLKTHSSNFYTIEKKGKKKLIGQVPYYKDEKFEGIIEISFEIPFEMSHFIRS
jgi:transcriptional regulator with PAS, ATPase and Fis domain